MGFLLKITGSPSIIWSGPRTACYSFGPRWSEEAGGDSVSPTRFTGSGRRRISPFIHCTSLKFLPHRGRFRDQYFIRFTLAWARGSPTNKKAKLRGLNNSQRAAERVRTTSWSHPVNTAPHVQPATLSSLNLICSPDWFQSFFRAVIKF